MNITMDDLQDYYRQLDNHDWFYDYSDDYHVWARGSAERTRLNGIATKNQRFADLFYAFQHWIYQERRDPTKKPELPA